MRLVRNEKFITEYNEFRQRLSRITDKNIRDEIEGMIITLVAEVKQIDTFHESLITGGQVSGLIDDSRDRIRDLRKKINRRLEDCERSGLFTNQKT
jgi:hypothetical protein